MGGVPPALLPAMYKCALCNNSFVKASFLKAHENSHKIAAGTVVKIPAKRASSTRCKTTTVTALAKVVCCDDLGFDRQAELSVHRKGNGIFSVKRLLRPNYVYKVTICYDLTPDTDGSGFDDEWVHGVVIKAICKGHAHNFPGI